MIGIKIVNISDRAAFDAATPGQPFVLDVVDGHHHADCPQDGRATVDCPCMPFVAPPDLVALAEAVCSVCHGTVTLGQVAVVDVVKIVDGLTDCDERGRHVCISPSGTLYFVPLDQPFNNETEFDVTLPPDALPGQFAVIGIKIVNINDRAAFDAALKLGTRR